MLIEREKMTFFGLVKLLLDLLGAKVKKCILAVQKTRT